MPTLETAVQSGTRAALVYADVSVADKLFSEGRVDEPRERWTSPDPRRSLR